MSVSKRKVGNRILTVLIAGLVIYLLAMFFFFNEMEAPAQIDRFKKTSVDDTPIFNLTEPHTQCQYVYDSVNKTVVQAKGSEHCQLPILN